MPAEGQPEVDNEGSYDTFEGSTPDAAEPREAKTASPPMQQGQPEESPPQEPAPQIQPDEPTEEKLPQESAQHQPPQLEQATHDLTHQQAAAPQEPVQMMPQKEPELEEPPQDPPHPQSATSQEPSQPVMQQEPRAEDPTHDSPPAQSVAPQETSQPITQDETQLEQPIQHSPHPQSPAQKEPSEATPQPEPQQEPQQEKPPQHPPHPQSPIAAEPAQPTPPPEPQHQQELPQDAPQPVVAPPQEPLQPTPPREPRSPSDAPERPLTARSNRSTRSRPEQDNEPPYTSRKSSQASVATRGGKAATVGASKEVWEQRTKENVSAAKALTRQVLESLKEEDDALPKVGNPAKKSNSVSENAKLVNNTIKKKIGLTGDLIKALEDRIGSVEDTMRQVGECLFQLQRAHRSKWGALNVCERRIELRDSRPEQELVQDTCQEALEKERQTLHQARKDLSDQAESMKEMLIALDRVKHEMIEDSQDKRHAMRIDRYCMNPRRAISGRRPEDRLVLPALHEVSHYGAPPSPKETAHGTGHMHEESRQEDTRALLAQAAKVEEEGFSRIQKSEALILAAKRECIQVTTQANAALSQKVKEIGELKKELESQIQETEETILQTEISLAKTRKKLEMHDQPLRTLDQQFHSRYKRREREGIRDHVHDELEANLGALKESVQKLLGRQQNTQTLLEQLKQARQQMKEDYRFKTLAEKIEDQCMKVTPRKALELDRMDPRGGRCKEGTPRKKFNSYQGYAPPADAA